MALIVIAAGLLAYALWKLEQGIFSRGHEGAGGHEVKDRIVNIAGGLVYVGFFLVAVRTMTGSGADWFERSAPYRSRGPRLARGPAPSRKSSIAIAATGAARLLCAVALDCEGSHRRSGWT